MMAHESRALINDQSIFIRCDLCHENLRQLSRTSEIKKEQQSKHANKPFIFKNLPEVIKHCIGVYLDFLDLTRLASTERANRNMLRNLNDGTPSPYLIVKSKTLRNAKLLTSTDINSYEKASGGLDTFRFFNECHSVTHFIFFGNISDQSLTTIAQKFPNIEHLSLKGTITFERFHLRGFLYQFEKLNHLGIKLHPQYDILRGEEIFALIEEKKFIELLY